MDALTTRHWTGHLRDRFLHTPQTCWLAIGGVAAGWSAHKPKVENERHNYSDCISDQIHSVEPGTDNEMADAIRSDRRDPRCLIELGEFHRETNQQRACGQSKRRQGGPNKRDAEEDHGCPQSVAWILTPRGGKQGWTRSGGESDGDDRENRKREQPPAANSWLGVHVEVRPRVQWRAKEDRSIDIGSGGWMNQAAARSGAADLPELDFVTWTEPKRQCRLLPGGTRRPSRHLAPSLAERHQDSFG